MLLAGTGSNGLAIVGLTATDRDNYSRKPLHRLPMVWQALNRADLSDTLTATLYGPQESNFSDLHARGLDFLQECQARDIRTIMAIGTQALRAVSPIHGRSIKLVGATITTGAVPFIIPLDTQQSYRAFRAYAWVQAMSRFIRRGLRLAQGCGTLFAFPTVVTGEGVNSLQALERIYDEKLPVGNDLETTGKDWRTDPITAMGLASASVSVSVPWQPYTSRLYGPQMGLRCTRTRKLATAILADPQITKIFHNGLFDCAVLRRKGIVVRGQIEDTYLAHKIVYPDLFHNLQFAMSYEHALHPWKTVFDLQRKARGEGSDWSDTNLSELLTYNAQDAAAELPLWARLIRKLSDMPRGLENYRKLMALGELAADMQYHGVRIDLGARHAVASSARARIAEIEGRWQRLTDIPLHGKGSTKGIRRLLFDVHKAPIIAKSRRTEKAQLSSAVLLEYAGMTDNAGLAELAWVLFEYRKITKSYDAFIAPLVESRVHARPNPAGTRGSRFSYSDPNLQQWSKEKVMISPLSKAEVQLAPNLRHLVCADDGMVLGEHDYNALEVRIMAYAANVYAWLDWLANGVDMHAQHVKLMFGRAVGKKDPLRQITKVLTFARFYNRHRAVGQVIKALKPSMPALTESFLEEVFARFDRARPEIVTWQDRIEALVCRQGFVELPLSGMRQYHDKRYPDINAALSFPIQSTGGDIINAAALRIRPRLDASRHERILINVHDALLWQAWPERVAQVAQIVKEEMERPIESLWGHSNVVFPTECRVGPNWRDLELLSA